MVLFGVEVIDCFLSKNFFRDSAYRLQDENLLRNPFKGKIKKCENIYVVEIEPLYFNFPLYAVIPIATTTILIFGFKLWLHLPLLIIGSLVFFWTKFFYFLMIIIGLKKAGYKGSIKFISLKRIIEKVVLNGAG